MMKLRCVAVVAPAQVTCLGTESRELAHHTDWESVQVDIVLPWQFGQSLVDAKFHVREQRLVNKNFLVGLVEVGSMGCQETVLG